MSNIRFAVIGAGVIAPYHARAVAHHPEAELVAVADIVPDKARRLAEEYGIPNVYTDYKEMLQRDDIDVVSVCVPSGLHAEAAIAVAEAGKHILCEKPLDITSEQMSRMIAAARSHNVKLGCVFQRRIMPSVTAARQAIQEGKLGKLVLGDAYLKYYRSPEYYKSAGWRGTWQWDGGGALMNQGVHGVDVIQYLMGGVSSVFAYAAPLVRDIEVEDTAVAVLKYKNGAFGVIQGTTSVYPNQETRFELHGEKGTIAVSDSGIQQWKMIDSDEQAPSVGALSTMSSTRPEDMSTDGHYLFVNDMIHAVMENREPLVNGEEARQSVDLILAIYESARTGKEVHLRD
ncbi:Gfo/Idh/MocA family oxidoreductase [Paenibacillus filicis]|uniref:Gfo/Idh/MocA family oxidoreductase n=1 Tax=Paenibacillus gyeongsangnamensis TaxID=3388067 RepID=A0ABT4QJ60_9BACL|nr:Gfo/Idh/MocA family oxidoreductase [Paenibacillus filicis]MCZ8516909.1 Gfo/Idh/MocA family oxidoreductase [Paenibacillus filicis]